MSSVADIISADSDLCSIKLSSSSIDGEIVARLSARLLRGEPFSSLGATLITLNPFRVLPSLVSDEAISLYFRGESMLLRPHPYAVASRALTLSSNMPQAIVVGGESGAGKTECARLLVSALAFVSKAEPKAATVSEKLISANLVLEAFGNARTARNDNSSRFAKWADLSLSPAGLLRGARVVVYLLDRSKVLDRISPYHAMRYLQAVPPDVRLSLRLPPSRLTPTAADAPSFRGLETVLKKLGVTDTKALWTSLSVVSNLLEVTFEEIEGGTIGLSASPSVDALCTLLNTSKDILTTSLTTREIIVNHETISHNNELHECTEAASSAAKYLYVATFDAVVRLVNNAVASCGDDDNRSLGILDVFGFEGESDSAPFSTLAINTANERLHNLFIDTVLRAEVELCSGEGVPFQATEVVGNDIVRSMLEAAKPSLSLWSVIDDATRLGNDVDICETLSRRMKHSPALELLPDGQSFLVHHTASDVKYHVEGLSSSNADRHPLGFERIVTKSPLAPMLCIEDGTPTTTTTTPATVAQVGVASKGPTLAERFRSSLTDLLNVLSQRKVHFIRCLLPNRQKKALTADPVVLQEQVKYLSLAAAHTVTAGGYSFHAPIEDFFNRYRILTAQSWSRGVKIDGGDAVRAATIALLTSAYIPSPPRGEAAAVKGDGIALQARILGVSLKLLKLPCDIPSAGKLLSKEDFAIGHTRVFLKDAITLEGLEHARQLALHSVIAKLQVAFRASACKAALHASLASFRRLQAIARGRAQRQILKRLRHAVTTVSAVLRGRAVRSAHATERETLGIIRSLHGKLRRTESLAWPPPPNQGYISGLDLMALSKSLPKLGFTLMTRPTFADAVIKIRPKGGLVQRGLIISSTHLITLDLPLNSHHPRVRSSILLTDIKAVYTSPFRDGLITFVTPQRGRDLTIVAETKTLLLDILTRALRLSSTNNNNADDSSTSPSTSPPPPLPRRQRTTTTPSTNNNNNPPSPRQPQQTIICATSWDIMIAKRRPPIHITIIEVPEGGGGGGEGGILIPSNVGGPPPHSTTTATATPTPSQIIFTKNSIKILAPGRKPRPPLQEILTPVELARLRRLGIIAHS